MSNTRPLDMGTVNSTLWEIWESERHIKIYPKISGAQVWDLSPIGKS